MVFLVAEVFVTDVLTPMSGDTALRYWLIADHNEFKRASREQKVKRPADPK